MTPDENDGNAHAHDDGGILGAAEQLAHDLTDKAITMKKAARAMSRKAERARQLLATARKEVERLLEA